MADEKIEVQWIGTANQMVQVLDRLEAKFDKQEAQLQKLATTSSKAADGAANSFNKLEEELKQNEAALKRMTMGTDEFATQRAKVDQLRKSVREAKNELSREVESPWPKIAQGMGIATAAAVGLAAVLIRVGQAQRDIISGGAETAIQLDEMARRMQIQAGLNDEQAQLQTRAIIQQANDAGLRAEVGFRVATQAASSGFADPVETGILKTVLDTVQASNFQGAPEEMVQAFAQALNASGLEKTNANLERMAVAAQSLFKVTDFQLVELSDFAKNASVFQGANMSVDESMAGFTALREVMPAAEAGTGLRNFVAKLQAGDLTKEQADNLQRIGVTADQVDFVGESLVDVITNIKKAADNLPEADRNAALGKMFGVENVASARLLLNSAERITELQQRQGNREQFDIDRNIAASGMRAEFNRIENERLINQIPIAGQIVQLEAAARNLEMQNKGIVEQAAVSGVPGLGAAAAIGSTVTEATDRVVGNNVVPAVNEGLFTLFSNLFGKSEQAQREMAEEQRRTNALLQEQVRRQQQPQRQPVAAPATRPKEAPRPAATAP
jgi:hypothetical protein